MSDTSINLQNKLSLISDLWQPRVIAEMNEYQFRLVKVAGDFVWHTHTDTDEAFLVISGNLRIDFRDGHVDLAPGDLYVVPKGREHKPFAEAEAGVLLIEPRGTRNTGDADSDRTAENDVWV